MSIVGNTISVLILRSDPQDRVSKDSDNSQRLRPSLETAATRPPQDEV